MAYNDMTAVSRAFAGGFLYSHEQLGKTPLFVTKFSQISATIRRGENVEESDREFLDGIKHKQSLSDTIKQKAEKVRLDLKAFDAGHARNNPSPNPFR